MYNDLAQESMISRLKTFQLGVIHKFPEVCNRSPISWSKYLNLQLCCLLINSPQKLIKSSLSCLLWSFNQYRFLLCMVPIIFWGGSPANLDFLSLSLSIFWCNNTTRFKSHNISIMKYKELTLQPEPIWSLFATFLCLICCMEHLI